MNYFYKAHAQASEKDEVIFFVVPSNETSQITTDYPPLTVEEVKQNDVYKSFAKQSSVKIKKTIMVDYSLYQTQIDFKSIDDSKLADYLSQLVENRHATFVSSGEIEICKGQSTKTKKSKNSKGVYIIAFVGIIVATIGGVLIGQNLTVFDSTTSSGFVENVENQILEVDGMIIPTLEQFNSESELLTISIDRSYSAVPQEDLQLKGEVIDGVAIIALPAFDRRDFFSHVPGHTWGFSSVPDAEKIEYYAGQSYKFKENMKLYRVLVKYGGGNGTKDDPYLLNYFDQISLLSEEKARGYFKQTADIVFPSWANHAPINTINELKQAHDEEELTPEALRFEYDGGGFSISGLNAPLFGTVSGSVIKNVNIQNSFIVTPEYRNLGFIVCEAYNYLYEVNGINYETGETLIKNSTVSHSSITLQHPQTSERATTTTTQEINAQNLPRVIPPEMLEEPEELPPPTVQAEYALGGITGLGGQIEDCYVTDVGIFAELDNYFLYAGGISGKPTNVINSGVYFLSLKGKIFHAGGIAGSLGGGRLYSATSVELPVFYGGNIMGCFVRKFSGYVENSVGGIVGESGTNVANAIIANSYATELDFSVGIFEDEERTRIIKMGVSGGIIGAEGNENYGHLVTNTVSLAGLAVIGSSRNSNYDTTVRIAPQTAFSHSGILNILNKNTVIPNNQSAETKEIFTGSFIFAQDERFSNDEGKFPFPVEVNELFGNVRTSEN